MIGPSLRLTLSLVGLAVLAAQRSVAQQPDRQQPAPRQPAPLPTIKRDLPQVVLSGAVDHAGIAEFGLGDGGVEVPRKQLRWHPEDGCVTPGGVRVLCREVGVKLTFPSGRELLVAPDGGLHLRSGEVGGPFPAGLELMLADGAAVRIVLAQSRRNRVRDVWVIDGERALQPWRGGGPADERGRSNDWAGIRVACCGDGGDLYRPFALGPLLVLDRVLVEQQRADETPRERLVVLTDPLRKSLAVMQRQHREANAAVRCAVNAVAGVAERGGQIFPAGAALRRAERAQLRWLLGGGFELELDLDGPLAPRLELFVGRSPLPMVEWTLGPASAAYLTNPRDDQVGKRWHGNGTRLPRVVPELQAREHLSERLQALQVIRRLAER